MPWYMVSSALVREDGDGGPDSERARGPYPPGQLLRWLLGLVAPVELEDVSANADASRARDRRVDAPARNRCAPVATGAVGAGRVVEVAAHHRLKILCAISAAVPSPT